jgi:pilus assembly protein CpaB
MWKVKRMNTAPTAMVRTTRRAGGIAAHPASGSVNKPSAAPVAQFQTVDVLVAKSDIGLGHVVRYGVSSPTTT